MKNLELDTHRILVKREIERWVENGSNPKIWVRNKKDESKTWRKVDFEDVTWSIDCYQIVDDKYAELRKLKRDKPETKIEYYSEGLGGWFETISPDWDLNTKFRVKREFNEPVFKVCNKGTDKEFVVKFTSPNKGDIVFALPESGYKAGYIYNGSLDDECLEDVAYNSERGFFDKQPIFCRDKEDVGVGSIEFYDAINDRTFTECGRRGGTDYDIYVAYPHPNDDFIVDMYRQLKD